MNAPTATDAAITSPVRFSACSRVGQTTFLSSERVSYTNSRIPAATVLPNPVIPVDDTVRDDRAGRTGRAGRTDSTGARRGSFIDPLLYARKAHRPRGFVLYTNRRRTSGGKKPGPKETRHIEGSPRLPRATSIIGNCAWNVKQAARPRTPSLRAIGGRWFLYSPPE